MATVKIKKMFLSKIKNPYFIIEREHMKKGNMLEYNNEFMIVGDQKPFFEKEVVFRRNGKKLTLSYYAWKPTRPILNQNTGEN